MGGTKRLMEEREEDESYGTGLLVNAGAAKRCEVHGYLLDREDSGAAEEVVEEFAEERGRDEAEERVKAALANAGMECPGCHRK
ncbi:hypothetical protein [Caulobacter sp. 602-1]|uniref:hypothetical protein n=1 Tax=Caulobacter sp. 602-1 TaxID=2492472 RepID=UPI0018F32360|nr:hypothetical protein [Caulobacter sp. 602-1]